MTLVRSLDSLAATEDFGLALARAVRPGDIVLLDGPLGAGKTTLTQAIARGLGVSERVTSPTFTVVRQHACVNDAGKTQELAELVRAELHIDWLNLQRVGGRDFGDMVSVYRRLGNYIRSPLPGLGIERCLYELNPGQHCLSPLMPLKHLSELRSSYKLYQVQSLIRQ